MGYTRYGAWYGGLYYGSEYSNWDSMFVAFCLDYAGVAEELTYNSGAFAWSVELSELGYYQSADAYTPEVGDVAFIDTDLDGRADVTAIVVAVDESVITVIQGNYADVVALVEYTLDETVLGYADVDYIEETEDEEITLDESDEVITEEIEELDVSAEDFATLEFVGEDYIITVSYGEDAALPEGTELVAYEYAQDSENFLARYAEAAELYGWEDSDETDPYNGFRLFNIGLYYEGAEIEPAAAVTVTVTYTGEGADTGSVYVTHFTDTATETLDATLTDGVVTFTADGFSEFGIMMASEEGIVLTSSSVVATSVIINGTSYSYDVYSVDEFYLWINDIAANNQSSERVYSSATWDDDNKGFIVVDNITNVLTYTDSSTTYYLIPISYFETYLDDYEFDSSNLAYCSLVYAPDADNTGKITSYRFASYVQVDSDWYLQVTDTGVGSYKYDADIPRSNVYYTTYLLTLYDGEYTDEALIGNQYISDYIGIGDCQVLVPISYFSDYVSASDLDAEVSGGTLTNSGSITICGEEYTTYTSNVYTFTYKALYYNSSAVAIDASYVKYNDTWYLLVQDKGTGYDVPVRNKICYTGVTVVEDVVSPSGTIISLFDYWTTGQEDVDVGINANTGINADHQLKFSYNGRNATSVFGTLADFNLYTQSADPYPDIVETTLGSDGYPVLNTAINGIDTAESLAYLFNTAVSQDGKESHRNVTGLLQVDEDGYYYYDCSKNYAEYDEDINSFILYDTAAVGTGQFFPFDSYAEAKNASDANDKTLNHYFGLTLTTRFVQQHGGYTTSSQKTKTTFEFSGDDDVWIFIDNVLVADLGGIHSATSVTIDFSTGAVTITGTNTTTTTLYDAYDAAGVASDYDWSGNTYENGTYHTLKFYYLERGNSASNLLLKFNMTEIPETAINKVNQYGEAIAGAEFAVYSATKDDTTGDYYYLYDTYDATNNSGAKELATSVSAKIDAGTYTIDSNGNICDSNGIIISAKYVGTTDANGEMEFVDDDQLPYTLKELEDMFGEYFILREIEVPDGYRLVSEDIYLRIVDSRVLDCENTYESGVYAAANEIITATDTLVDVDGKTINYVTYDTNDDPVVTGTLFAVVMKYIGDGDASIDNDASHWAPVYGTDEIGYTVMSNYESVYGDDNIVAAAIDAAKIMESNGYSDSVFELSTSGSMQVYLTALPGDISTYYYLAQDSSTQYTVAVYYTTATSLDNATDQNTVRIDTEANGGFTRTFGASIQVPNLSNMLLVQKLDVYGNLVNGARFALFEVEEVTGDKIYYVGYDNSDTKTLIYLYPDDDGDNAGTAELQDGSTGTYAISSAEDSTEGVITVVIDGTTYTITPKEVETTVAAGDQTSAYTGFKYTTDEDGTAVFDNLEEEIGTYYIREISAPSGYLLNTTEVMVLVTSSTVYANAGTDADGVSVARSAGYIVSTLDQMAVIGDIDNTLSWIYTTLQVNTSQANTFNFAEYDESANGIIWDALTDHAYLEYDGTLKSTINDYVANSYYGSNTTKLSTDEGWSYLQIFQDSSYHDVRVSDPNTNTSYAYTYLGTNPITSLYSRSVYVQVTDQFVQVELPETGGVSLPVAYAVGSLMIIISAALLILRRNKKSIHE